MPFPPLRSLLPVLSALFLFTGCNTSAFFAGNPASGVNGSPGRFTGPTPPPLSACEKPSAYGDLSPDPWLRADLSGIVRDAAGSAVPGATIQVRITKLGDDAALRAAIPPTSRGWAKGPDGAWTCSQTHVLVIGDFTKFPNGTDNASTTSGTDGAWKVAGGPAGATYELTVTKEGFAPLRQTVTTAQNPDNRPGLNRLELTLDWL